MVVLLEKNEKKVEKKIIGFSLILEKNSEKIRKRLSLFKNFFMSSLMIFSKFCQY